MIGANVTIKEREAEDTITIGDLHAGQCFEIQTKAFMVLERCSRSSLNTRCRRFANDVVMHWLANPHLRITRLLEIEEITFIEED